MNRLAELETRNNESWNILKLEIRESYHRVPAIQSVRASTCTRIIWNCEGIFDSLHKKNEVFHKRFLQQMWPNPQETADLVTFTEEFLNGKLFFLCSDCVITFSMLCEQYRKLSRENSTYTRPVLHWYRNHLTELEWKSIDRFLCFYMSLTLDLYGLIAFFVSGNRVIN